jgi:type I restriction enzyme S subunit
MGGTKPALVPKLRFPEFRETEGWKVKKLSSSVQLISGAHLSPDQYGKDGAVPYFTGPSDFTNNVESITKRTSDSASTAKEDDTLITVKGSGVGEIWYLTLSAVAIGRQLMAIRATDSSSRFVYQFLLTKRHRFEDLAAGSLIPGLARGEILDLEAPFPSRAEQQKIAECLSSADELIAAQARKVDALKTHKKGLMQQLFPREGETQPRLRFPEFENAGEWQTLPLVALADKIMVGIASAATHAYRETGVPMLRNQNIKEGKIDDSSLLFIDPAYEAAHKNKRLRAGDVITVRTGYPGVSAVVPERYNNAQCFTSLITRPNKAVLDANYLCAFVNSEIGKRFILGAEAGGAQKNVNAGSLEALPVYLPETPEQQRIAECLSSLDARITAETQKLETLKTHKRGLMQQLFPSPE